MSARIEGGDGGGGGGDEEEEEDQQEVRTGRRSGPPPGEDEDDQDPVRTGRRAAPPPGGDEPEEPVRTGRRAAPPPGEDEDDQQDVRTGRRAAPPPGGDEDDQEPDIEPEARPDEPQTALEDAREAIDRVDPGLFGDAAARAREAARRGRGRARAGAADIFRRPEDFDVGDLFAGADAEGIDAMVVGREGPRQPRDQRDTPPEVDLEEADRRADQLEADTSALTELLKEEPLKLPGEGPIAKAGRFDFDTGEIAAPKKAELPDFEVSIRTGLDSEGRTPTTRRPAEGESVRLEDALKTFEDNLTEAAEEAAASGVPAPSGLAGTSAALGGPAEPPPDAPPDLVPRGEDVLFGAAAVPTFPVSVARAGKDIADVSVGTGAAAARGDLDRVAEILADADQTVKNEASKAASGVIEDPARAAAVGVGGLIATGGVFAGARAVGPTASRVTRASIQPGEEALGIGGHALTRRTFGESAAEKAFPGKEPLIFSEEAAIRGARRAARRGRDIARRIELEPRRGFGSGPQPPKVRFRSETETGREFMDEELERVERAQARRAREVRERVRGRFDVERNPFRERARRGDLDRPAFETEVEGRGELDRRFETATDVEAVHERPIEPRVEFEPDLDVEPRTEPEVDVDVETEEEAEPDIESEPRLDFERELELETEAELEFETERELETELAELDFDPLEPLDRAVGVKARSAVFKTDIPTIKEAELAFESAFGRERKRSRGLDPFDGAGVDAPNIDTDATGRQTPRRGRQRRRAFDLDFSKVEGVSIGGGRGRRRSSTIDVPPVEAGGGSNGLDVDFSDGDLDLDLDDIDPFD